MMRTLGGRYRLTDFVASGRTGEVWRALDEGTDRTVAVKMLYPNLAADAWLAERFVRSRGELTALWHPCIARLLDVVADADTLGLVTDLVPGTDLGRRLAAGRPIGAGSVAQIAVAVADALSAAHRLGVVHGDLKPSNVLIPPAATGPARVTDFAVAVLVRPGRWYESSRYRAPEVTDGATPAAASDVYSFGVLLRDMLNGQGPEPLRELASACVAADPGARPSAAHVNRELREMGAEPIEAADPTRVGITAPRRAPARPPKKREPVRSRRRVWLIHSRLRLALVLVAAMLVTLGVIAATRAFWIPPGEAQESPPTSPTAGSRSGGEPSIPAAAMAHTQEGGKEFVRYWFDTLTYTARTGDTADLLAATSADCANCQAAMRSRAGAYLVRNVSTDSLFTLDRPVYSISLDRAASDSLPALSFASCVVILEWTDRRWRVLEIPTKDCVA